MTDPIHTTTPRRWPGPSEAVSPPERSAAGSSGTPPQPPEDRAADLAQIIEAYNHVTERLQQSHETLTGEVQRLQAQLASANAALQRSKRLAALGEMAAGIAHEVRNPLASIQLYARMLEEDLTDRPEQHGIAGKIASAVRGLDAIVSDVLTFSREMKVRPTAGDARELFDRAVEAVRPMIDMVGVEVRYEIEGRHLGVPHDPELMHQALVNVIRNGVQAMEHGRAEEAPGILTLSAAREGDTIRLGVHDTGPGIREESIDRIFNPFFTTRAAGTGLGLAIVHRIVDAHSGSIAVHNDPADGGAVFTITLPGGPDRDARVSDLRDPGSDSSDDPIVQGDSQ